MTLFQAKSTGAYPTAVTHLLEAESIVTGEKDRLGFPIFLTTTSLCGRKVRATGSPASPGTRDLCSTCRNRAFGRPS